jgi:hypothetical protein
MARKFGQTSIRGAHDTGRGDERQGGNGQRDDEHGNADRPYSAPDQR